jgi:hypothetical protein
VREQRPDVSLEHAREERMLFGPVRRSPSVIVASLSVAQGVIETPRINRIADR